MPELTTDRLRLRAWRPDDADFVFDLYSRWEVKRYIGSTPTVMTDRSEAVAQIARLRAFKHSVLGYWAVERRDTGALVGTVLFKSIPASGPTEPPEPSGDIELGWHFHPDAWGHGFATEAAAAVLSRAWDAGLERVIAVTNPENFASQAVCRRIGMTPRGRTTRYYNADCELFVAERPNA